MVVFAYPDSLLTYSCAVNTSLFNKVAAILYSARSATWDAPGASCQIDFLSIQCARNSRQSCSAIAALCTPFHKRGDHCRGIITSKSCKLTRAHYSLFIGWAVYSIIRLSRWPLYILHLGYQSLSVNVLLQGDNYKPAKLHPREKDTCFILTPMSILPCYTGKRACLLCDMVCPAFTGDCKGWWVEQWPIPFVKPWVQPKASKQVCERSAGSKLIYKLIRQ